VYIAGGENLCLARTNNPETLALINNISSQRSNCLILVKAFIKKVVDHNLAKSQNVPVGFKGLKVAGTLVLRRAICNPAETGSHVAMITAMMLLQNYV
jgi:hypothetical protein